MNAEKLHADEKEILLAEIFEDFGLVKPFIENVIEEVKNRDVSNYPIIVLSKEIIQLGLPFINSKEIETKWHFNISHLEEFVVKKLVEAEKAKEFIKVYKKHHNSFCLFVRFNETDADFAYVNKNQI